MLSLDYKSMFEVFIKTSDEGEEWTYSRVIQAESMEKAIIFVKKKNPHLHIVKVLYKGYLEVAD